MTGAARELFRDLEAAHARACLVAPARQVTLEVLGRRLVLEFAGEALEETVLPALEHRVRAGPPPPLEDRSLTLRLFTSAETGVAPPPRPWGDEAHGPQGRILGWDSPELRVTYQDGVGSLSMFDVAARRALFWVDDAARIPWYECSAPLRSLLHAWAAAEGLQLVHGGAVAHGDLAALIVGPSGSGKSSSCLACLGAPDLAYLADDYVLLEPGPPARVASLYRTGKLRPDQLARVARGSPLAAAPTRPAEHGGEKTVVFVDADPRPRRLAMLVWPRITGGPGHALEPMTRGEALRALAPSTLFQLPGAGAADLARMGAVVRAVPCRRLQLGTDLEALPATLAGWLAAP